MDRVRVRKILSSLFLASGLFIIWCFVIQPDRVSDQTKETYPGLPTCSCPNRVIGPIESSEKKVSSCSDSATKRGSGQKVVSYSYYGHTADSEVERKYFGQIEKRAEEIEQLYPGWSMRIYIRPDEDGDDEGLQRLCDIFCRHEHVDICDVDALPGLFLDLPVSPVGTIWRFLTIMDPLVDLFISRDLDSAILPREVSAVEEWVQSDKTFHIMRDHPSHNGPMMAGLWGAKVKGNRQVLMDALFQILTDPPRSYWAFDQALLRRFIWPLARRNVLQHDAYYCSFRKFNSYGNEGQPFPTKREGLLYVGWGEAKAASNQTGITPCPTNCRPEGHKDWIYC